MLGKIKKNLISEKIPAIVCMTACMASVLMGFVLGYAFFGMGEPVLVYGDAAENRQYAPHMAALSPEVYELPMQNPGRVISPSALDNGATGHLYVVTVMDGYIAVYHSEERGGGLKEVTSTAIDALPAEEQERLMAGIHVYSDEELAWILQDYGS